MSPLRAPWNVAASSGDDGFTLDEAVLAERRAATARRVHTVQIPALRFAGFAILCAIALLQAVRSEGFPQPALLWLLAGNLGYAGVAWWVLRRGWGRVRGLDLSLLLFHVDILVWLPNLYYLEQSHLFFAYFLLVRVVDQVGFGFRRALYFGHVVTLAYLAYAVWASVHAAQPVPWTDRVGIAAVMYLLGLYFALTGLVTERLRQRSSQAMRAARELVASLAQKAEALELQTRELELARHQAEQASEAKSQFLAVTSHEIRTPMNGILGAAELLSGTPLTPAQQRYVQITHQSATALLTLIDDVLDLSRIEAGKLTLNLASVELRAVVAEAVDLVRMAARDKPVTLTDRVSSRLPSRVLADPLRLRQLLVNLLHNAVKFTERGTVALEVTCIEGGTADAPRLRFSVRDTGIGIEQAQLGSIFDAFSQADSSSTRRYGGSGLGLAIVKELTALMEGEVHVESRPGEGSHFWIDLVLDRAPDDGLVADSLEDAEEPVGVSALVAEDDPVNQMLIVEMLRMLGCSVDLVADGDAARRAAAAGSYDIVFMDCHMPVTDGYEATRRIREDERRSGGRTVIVAVTADALASDQVKCIEAGMDAFLIKPVSTAQLSATIERWTGHRTNPATQW
ncbi:MAG TPA: ATP-binding protein [Caldimonas sp.]|jgi:signal transduction histidine kinase/CheY-like chemotaxis protein|nr:ATP-binding protein [Caldimonas sp.]HEX2542655.1 ATP-binding protein [Caldimonas sp.]